MRYSDWYTRVLLTVIAGLLAWNLVSGIQTTTVRGSSRYEIAILTADAKLAKPYPQWGSMPYASELAAAINSAAKGRELVTVIWLEPSDKYAAVFRQR